MMEEVRHTGLGEILRQSRVAKGISQDSLAHRLRLPVHILQAIETEDWDHIPPGRARPLTRIVAKRLSVNLADHTEAFAEVPGAVDQEPPDPRQEQLERILTGAIAAASLALLIWLVVPGKDMRQRLPVYQTPSTPPPFRVTLSQVPAGPYPVLGEVLPEAPITEEGVLVSLRSLDACEVRIQNEGTNLQHSLRISEPWRVRVKGPFTLNLDNAGVVTLEVAGRIIHHDRNVGESWIGTFGIDGLLQLPHESTSEVEAIAPETESEDSSDSPVE